MWKTLARISGDCGAGEKEGGGRLSLRALVTTGSERRRNPVTGGDSTHGLSRHRGAVLLGRCVHAPFRSGLPFRMAALEGERFLIRLCEVMPSSSQEWAVRRARVSH